MMRRWIGWMALPLTPFGLAAGAILIEDRDRGVEAALEVGVLMISLSAVLCAGGGPLTLRSVVTELLAMISGAVIGSFLIVTASEGRITPWAAGISVASCWWLPWATSLLFRSLGADGLALASGLLVLGLQISTPFLLPSVFTDLPRGVRYSPYAPIPEWVLELNPLVRVHGSLLGQDWFHAPMLYPRVGERAYHYPEWSAGVLGLLGASLFLVCCAWSFAVPLRRFLQPSSSRSSHQQR